MRKLKNLLDPIDKGILEELYTRGDIEVAYRMWCYNYFKWEPLEKQEQMVSIGFNPMALYSKDITYENLYDIKNLDVLAAIRSGKTLGIGMKFLFLAWAFPGTEWANMGPSVDQAATMFRLLLAFVSMPKFERFVVRPDGGNNPIQRHPFPVIYLWNGSTLEFRGAGKAYVEQIRSREYDGINVDEAALFSEYSISILEGRVLGAKAGRKRVGLFSLTTSKRATARWLFEHSLRGVKGQPKYVPGYYTLEMKTRENVHLDAARVESIAAGMSSQLRRQEIENEWLEMGLAVFLYDVLQRSFSTEGDPSGIVKQLEDAVALSKGDKAFDTEWEEYQIPAIPGHYYVGGIDIGKGRKSPKFDENNMGQRGALSAHVFDVTEHPWRVVAMWYETNTGSWLRAISLAQEIRDKYPGIELGWDSTGPGDVIDELADAGGMGVEFPVKFLGNIIKTNIARNLAWALEHDMIKGPFIRLLFNQLMYYVLDDDDISQDAAISLMIAAHIARARETAQTGPMLDEEIRTVMPYSRDAYGRGEDRLPNQRVKEN